MFWNKHHQPPTPKMTPVSLPLDYMSTPQWHPDPRMPLIYPRPLRERNHNAPHPTPVKHRHELAERHIPNTSSGWYSDVDPQPRTRSRPSDTVPERRSRTPRPESAHPRHDPAGAQGHRMKKSISNSTIDEAMKPLKGILKTPKSSANDEEFFKPVVPVPPHDRGGSSKLDQTDDLLKPHKSILKGGGHSYNGTAAHRMERTPSYAGHPSANAPLMSQQATPSHRPSTYSSAGHEAHVPYAPPLDKYTVKTHVIRVVQKEEAIALSWPLTTGESAGRKRYPLVYYDIWFNPRHDPSAVKAYRRGYFEVLSEGDRNLPASSHCTINEMDITCPIMDTSFMIRIRRRDGIRCIDVLQEIFNAYDQRLSREEQQALALEIDERCVTAFKRRCKDAPHLPPVNERQGMRRVDLLRGRRVFNGLIRDPRSQTWLLEFHRPVE